MKLALQQIVSKATGNWAEVEQCGTFGSTLEDTDIVKFSDANLEGVNKKEDGSPVNVIVMVKTVDNEVPYQICCSTRLSKNIRKALNKGQSKRAVLGMLMNLDVIKNDKAYFIVSKGTITGGVTKAELLADEIPTYEEFMAAIGF